MGLYVADMEQVRAWDPGVPGVAEVFHATFDRHAYPAHTHDRWTLLVVDEGAVSYDLDRWGHHAAPSRVTILPPHVPHDGRSARDGHAFRKRVLYLDEDWLPPPSIAAAVDAPTLLRPDLATTVDQLHQALAEPGEHLAAEGLLLDVQEAVTEHLHGARPTEADDVPLAARLRTLLDDRLAETVTLDEASTVLGATPRHLSRCFTRAYGIPPHRYVTGRRVDRARSMLLAGTPTAEVASATGFHDQPHLTRHFRRLVGTTPAAFARPSSGSR